MTLLLLLANQKLLKENPNDHANSMEGEDRQLCCHKYTHYNYCQSFINSLVSGRVYYTDRISHDFYFCLLNNHTLLSMFAALPQHPNSRYE